MTKNIHHKRTLYFKNFENNYEGNIWSLFWYGRVFFNYSESRFYIEAYLALMRNDDYFLNNINKNRIEKVEIPFSKSILFPLSSQFDYQGKFLSMSSLYNSDGEVLRNGLYKTNRLKISNDYNFRITELDNIFSNTLFPDVIENGVSIYRDSSYFTRKIESIIKKEGEDDKKIIYQYIIPIDVILKFFVGYSSLILDLLITNRLRYAIFNKSFDSKTRKGKLYYDSNYITRSDASLIAKYFFTKNNYAEKLFYNIGSYFSMLRLNNIKEGSFIKYKIPFDFPCDFIFVGQYFTKNNSEISLKKIIVNQILEISADKDFFLVDGEIDLIDTNSSQNQSDEQNTTNGKDVRTNNETKPTNENSNESEDLPLNINNNDRIIDNPVVLRNCFTESPVINHLVMSEDKNGNPIYLNDERPDEHQDFSGNDEPNGRNINNFKDFEWIEIIEEALDYLEKEYHYKKERLSDTIREKLTKKIIFSLTCKGVNYYILDSGGNNYFPLFRNKNKYKSIDIDAIYDIINVIKKDFKSSWSIVSTKKSLKSIDKFLSIDFFKDNDISFLRNNTHEIIGEFGKDDVRTKTMENLANKIHKKIIADLRESSEN